jgi:peptidyl-prolyl cis-trans isomerase SurA
MTAGVNLDRLKAMRLTHPRRKPNLSKIQWWCAGVALLFLLTLGSPVPGLNQEKVLVNRIVAEVNDDIITLYELNLAVAPYVRRVRSMGRSAAEEQKMLYDVREQMLNQLIENKLTDQEVRRYNISISEETIDNTIEEIKKRSRITDQQLRAGLSQQGLTMDDYRQDIKNQILRTRLVNRQIKSKIVITEEDIQAYYEQNKAAYGGEALYRLRQIIVGFEEGEAQAQQKMEMVLVKFSEGVAFDDLAREYSDGPTAADGGYLGDFNLEDLATPIRSALKGLEVGEHTPIIKTGRGLQVFYIDDVKTETGKSLEEMKPEIERKLYDTIVNRKFKGWLAELRERSHVKIIR